MINQAIENEQMLKIVFKNWKGEKIYVTCAPVWVEYSRRDDVLDFGISIEVKMRLE